MFQYSTPPTTASLLITRTCETDRWLHLKKVELIWKSVVSPPTSVEEILDILQKENVDSNFSETNNFNRFVGVIVRVLIF